MSLLSALLLAGAGGTAAAAADFARDIQPLLEEHCYDCHGEDKAKSKLRLDSVAGILKGGESGDPLFLRGNSTDSLILHRVMATNPKEVMPPKGETLTEAQTGLMREWIDAGAAMPGEKEAAASLKLTTDHWSFQPVQRPPIPRSGDPAAQNEVDEFLLAKLREKGLTMSPSADPRLLIRRLYLVMHGMPPSPQEVEEFVSDTRPDAWPRLVDRVLASPRYGERWARHWMDVARYADTNGFETNRERKTAWPYRDWVIAAFNSDKPYDQFIREQLAGDALGADAATGFLVAGAYDIVKAPDINLTLMQRQDELADMVNTTGTAFLGLTMGCARCHNHKFDPILQKDYYSMQAVFAGVTHGERPLRREADPDTAAKLITLREEAATAQRDLDVLRDRAARMVLAQGETPQRPAVNAQRNEEVFAPVETSAVRFTIAASSAAEPCLDELEIYNEAGQNVALASTGAKPSASGSLSGYPIHRLAHLNDGLSGNEHSWICDAASGWVQIDFPAPVRIQRIVWGRDRAGRFRDRVAVQYTLEAATGPDQWSVLTSSADRAPFTGAENPDAFLTRLSAPDATAARDLISRLAGLRSRIDGLANAGNAWLGTFSQPDKTHRLYRGDPMAPREVVPPDSLTVISSLGLAADAPEQTRRVKLAEWIASPQNPLTARVMVNRLWHYIFGRGIVDTPSDFGGNGSRPTHPELLDWLADEFVRSGWSVKHVQRLILLSATFRQDSAPRPDAQAIDAGGSLLWRYSPRRLEAEAIRDSMLTVSGSMDLTMGGPGFYLMDVQEENVMHYFAKEKFTPAEFRRMVYQFRIRQTTDSVFSAFDCPDGGQVMPRRSRSNTPLQALNLFNSTFVLQQADLLATRLQREAGDSPEAQIDRAWPLFYGRPPDVWERTESAALIRQEGLPALCRVLYNSSEFLFLF